MEIRKNIKNHFFLFYLLTVAICFVLGYVLLVSLDKISNPTISELYVSIYTVITQFGMLIFPVLIIQSFVSDYKNKNILFYKLMGYNWLRYFLTKIAVILAWMSIIVFGGVIGISIVYQDFSYTLATLFYFESAIIYEILLASMWGFLFKSVIGAYVVNFAFWLFSMVASIANPKLSFLVRYDASNPVFIKFNQYFNTRNSDYLMIQENILTDEMACITINSDGIPNYVSIPWRNLSLNYNVYPLHTIYILNWSNILDVKLVQKNLSKVLLQKYLYFNLWIEGSRNSTQISLEKVSEIVPVKNLYYNLSCNKLDLVKLLREG